MKFLLEIEINDSIFIEKNNTKNNQRCLLEDIKQDIFSSDLCVYTDNVEKDIKVNIIESLNNYKTCNKVPDDKVVDNTQKNLTLFSDKLSKEISINKKLTII